MCRSRQAGAALLLTLWIVSLLMVMAATLSRSVLLSTKASSVVAEKVVAEAILDSAANRLAFELVTGGVAAEERWSGDGKSLQVNGRTVKIRLSNETGRVDVNFAPTGLLVSALMAAGLDRETAEQHVQRQRPVNAAQQPSLGLPVFDGQQSSAGGGRLAFQSISEFLSGAPIPEESRACLPELFTVFTHVAQIDMTSAHALLKKRLEDITVPNSNERRSYGLLANEQSSLAGRTFNLYLEISDGGAIPMAQRRIFKITGSRTKPTLNLKRDNLGRSQICSET